MVTTWGCNTNRAAQRLIKRCSGIDALAQDVICQAKPHRQNRQGDSLAVPFYPMIVATIVLLLAFACPPAIAGLVVSINVDSIKAGSVRTETHIRQKLLEASAPRGTNLHATATVIGEGAVVRVLAPLDHSPPGAMLSASRHAVTSFDCKYAHASTALCKFVSITPTRDCGSILNGQASNAFDCPASTLTNPPRIGVRASFGFVPGQYGQSTENVAYQIHSDATHINMSFEYNDSANCSTELFDIGSEIMGMY